MLSFELATSDEIARELGARLRAHRLAQNLKQSELAARAGVSVRTLQNLERDGQGAVENLLQVVMALGLIGEMAPLFEYQPKSIKAMEQASAIRQRASRGKP